MYRKLTNSLSALIVTGAVLVVTVVFGLNPLSPEPAMDPVLATADGPAPVADDAAIAPSSASHGTGSGTGQLIRTLAMPYFSFVPRG